MANPKEDHKTRLDVNDKEARDITQSFVYRDDMDLAKVAEYLETDWDNAYDWLKERLEQVKDDE